ncbi:MAG TPA: EamA family transporter RarD [Rhizobiales bacterium]|nr:EamA family transporter RarD [Hyphomicrobiales bacterium]
MKNSRKNVNNRSESSQGVIYAVAAFGLWALNPLYFKLLAGVSPFEVITHRAFWSVPFGVAVVLYLSRTSDIARVFKRPDLLLKLMMTGLIISGNWVIFVWAVAVDLTLEASLGYFINPLLNVIIGYLLLGERLTTAQTVAVLLAALGVVIQTVGAGVFPWVAIVLAVLFAAYGYVRKTIDVGPVQGFVIETTMLLPFSIAYAIWLAFQGTMQFASNATDTFLLVLSGPVTAIPLMLFASGARRLRYSTIGILQYIAPSGMFLIAVFVFKEQVGFWKLVSFAFIWVALAIYSYDAFRQERADRKTL